MASNSSNGSPEATYTVDPYESLGLILNQDGSITRKSVFPFSPATPGPDQSCPVLSKDIPLNQSTNTWVRIYMPREALDISPTCKLPLIVFFHGGGFIVGSVGDTFIHDFITILAVKTQSVIVSVEYRLAPEHRLPAAYDDCLEALHWVKNLQDEWLTKFADLSNCFLMGGSAGGNIAYHVGLRVISTVHDLEPLKIKGLIMQQPFFGGVQRTESEIKTDSKFFTLNMSDLMWELSLPIGADRDHEYCNPGLGDKSSLWAEIKRLGWKIIVTGCDGDHLIDHQVKLVKLLEEKGIDITSRFCEGFYHGYEVADSSKAEELCGVIKNFISPICNTDMSVNVQNTFVTKSFQNVID